MGIALETPAYYNLGGGLDLSSSPTKTPEEKSTGAFNTDYTQDGAIRTRYGSQRLNPSNQISGAPRIIGLFDYRKSDGNEYEVIAAGDDLYLDLASPVAQGFSLNTTAYPDFEFLANQFDEYLWYGNGVDTNLKFDGTTWTNWSIVAPIAPSNPVQAAGNLVAGDYSYLVTFANYDVLTGIIVQESPVLQTIVDQVYTPSSLDVTVPGGPDQKITMDIPVSADPQVNARIIYRRSPTSSGFFFQHDIITDNVTASYTDNTLDDTTDLLVDLNNFNASKTDVFCEYGGRMFLNNVDSRTDLMYSAVNQPWSVSPSSLDILDGKITAMIRFFGTLIIGTDRSLWVQSGDPDDPNSTLKRISSKIGILNNRCVAGESILYFVSSSYKLYALRPTDLTQDEIRIDQPLSDDVRTEFAKFSIAREDYIGLEYFTEARASKVYITYNIGAGNNKNVLVYNETQSIQMGYPVWQNWDHIEPSILKQFNTASQQRLIFGDFNGFLWQLEYPNIDGDGAEVNGTATGGGVNTLEDTDDVDVASTATAGGAATLTDAAQAWAVNQWATVQVYIHAGTGSGQTRTIQSNTADTLTVSVPWAVVPDATSQYYIGGLTVDGYIGVKLNLIAGTGSGQEAVIVSNTPTILTVATNWTVVPDNTTEYTIGGFHTLHFTNWKYVLVSYDILKQLWYIWLNANANGDYNITMIVQVDFDTSTNNQTNILVNLSALNSIWGQFLWGAGVWGSRSVFTDRFRVYSRFRAIRIGFENYKAGQPWQINGLSLSCQNKGLFFGPST